MSKQIEQKYRYLVPEGWQHIDTYAEAVADLPDYTWIWALTTGGIIVDGSIISTNGVVERFADHETPIYAWRIGIKPELRHTYVVKKCLDRHIVYRYDQQEDTYEEIASDINSEIYAESIRSSYENDHRWHG